MKNLFEKNIDAQCGDAKERGKRVQMSMNPMDFKSFEFNMVKLND
jgi:hypothetical protein